MPSPPPAPPPLFIVLKDRNENFAADETVDELKQCHTHTHSLLLVLFPKFKNTDIYMGDKRGHKS